MLRVCTNTRNIGRLAPKGDVEYDETKPRYSARIKVDECYRTHRVDGRGGTIVGPHLPNSCIMRGVLLDYKATQAGAVLADYYL